MKGALTVMSLVLLGTASLLPAMGGPDLVEAQQSEIQVFDQRVETNFPTDVKFYVEAGGPDEIEEVRVVIKTLGQTTRSAYRQVEFEPGTSVSGEAELLTSGNNYVPPGTRMAYSFEVRDKAGRELQTEEQVFVYLDSRFEWFNVSEGLVTVYYNDPLVKSRAEHVLETALTSMAITGPLLGIEPDVPLHIITYHKYRDMIGALPFRSDATSSQLITQGMAFDEERVLMVHSGDSSVTSTTAHEFVHLLVGDALGRAYSRVPAWLNEGLAEFGSRHDGDRHIVNRGIARALENGTIRPLWHLGTFSGTPQEIIYAYAHGEAVVTFMVWKYGEGKMAELMQAITRTLDIDSALMEVYGLDQHGIDSAWRQEIGLEPLPRPDQPRRHPLLENIPDATIAPILMPTFAPRETEPETAPAVEPRPEPTQAPAVVVEPQPTVAPPPALVEGPTPAAQERPLGKDQTPGVAPGGCSPPLAQDGFAGEPALLLLLVGPVGLVGMRRLKRRKRWLT